MKDFSRATSQSPSSIAAFIDCILTGAVIAHKMHLKVTGPGSYAAHKALDELYTSLPSHGDSLAETYQGQAGTLITSYPSMDQTECLKMTPLQFTEYLIKYTEDNRKVFGTSTMLQNQVDELQATLSSVRYKLKFLS